MALLIEITVNATVRRISHGAHALDTYQWRPYLIGFDPIRFAMSKKYGGYVSVDYGQMTLSPELFAAAADWPPPVSNAVTVKYLDLNTSTDESTATTLFTGTAHLVGTRRDGITFRLYAPEYDINLLETGTDYDGNTVALPRAFGAIVHQTPVRVADAGGQPTYHKAGITGVLGADYHIYDDGVNVDANGTDNGTTISLSVAPVGEITLSGTGLDSTLSTIFDWACGAGFLNLTYNSTLAEAPSPGVIYWATSQMPLTDFLSEVSAFFSHIFYISATTLYLVDMAEDNGSQALNDYGFLKNGDYFYEDPVSIITSKWQTRAAVEETIGKYIKTYDHETYVASDYPYGSLIDIKPFHTTQSNIDTALGKIEDTLHAPVSRVSIPLTASVPAPGKKITITDTVLKNDTTAVLRVRTMSMDFDNKKVFVEGEGSIS